MVLHLLVAKRLIMQTFQIRAHTETGAHGHKNTCVRMKNHRHLPQTHIHRSACMLSHLHTIKEGKNEKQCQAQACIHLYTDTLSFLCAIIRVTDSLLRQSIRSLTLRKGKSMLLHYPQLTAQDHSKRLRLGPNKNKRQSMKSHDVETHFCQ